MSDVVSSENNVRLRALIRGRVQGVFFRDFARYHAQGLGLVGWVRNLSDSRTVEVIAEGPPSDLKELLRNLRDGPPSADVESVDVDVSESLGEFGLFEICQITKKCRIFRLLISVIPTKTSVSLEVSRRGILIW